MANEVDRVKVVDALALILTDPKFKSAPKASAVLQYVVLETLEGNANRIKAYTIAIDALNKHPTFDPQDNPLVRVMAKRLRNSLHDYYSRTSNHEVIFQMNPGSYVPQFLMRSDFDMNGRHA